MTILLSELFDGVFIVNLPERSDRREEMEIELKKANLTVDGEKIVFFPAIKPDEKGEFPSIGARGCLLSHLEILKQAQAKQMNSVLFMEDDLAISGQIAHFSPQIKRLLAERPWSIVYLGHIENLPIPENGKEFDLIEWDKDKPLMTTHFYAVNGDVIPRLIDFLEILLSRPAGHPDGGPMHYDGALSTFRQQNPDIITFLANPNTGWQRSSRSDIADPKWFDKIPFVSHAVSFIRKIRNQLKP